MILQFLICLSLLIVSGESINIVRSSLFQIDNNIYIIPFINELEYNQTNNLI